MGAARLHTGGEASGGQRSCCRGARRAACRVRRCCLASPPPVWHSNDPKFAGAATAGRSRVRRRAPPLRPGCAGSPRLWASSRMSRPGASTDAAARGRTTATRLPCLHATLPRSASDWLPAASRWLKPSSCISALLGTKGRLGCVGQWRAGAGGSPVDAHSCWEYPSDGLRPRKRRFARMSCWKGGDGPGHFAGGSRPPACILSFTPSTVGPGQPT